MINVDKAVTVLGVENYHGKLEAHKPHICFSFLILFNRNDISSHQSVPGLYTRTPNMHLRPEDSSQTAMRELTALDPPILQLDLWGQRSRQRKMEGKRRKERKGEIFRNKLPSTALNADDKSPQADSEAKSDDLVREPAAA